MGALYERPFFLGINEMRAVIDRPYSSNHGFAKVSFERRGMGAPNPIHSPPFKGGVARSAGVVSNTARQRLLIDARA